MIIIAPDSFKGTLSAPEVCEIIKSEFLKQDSRLEIKCFPIADGGEGTVDALLYAGGRKVTVKAKDPYMRDIDSFYGILPDGTAVIEMAAASGLPLAGENRNPLLTTTYGTGQLIADAVEKGAKKILIGIGGSATNDGGIGCAAALGARFYDGEKNEVSLCGESLGKIRSIDLGGIDRRVYETEIKVLCDVVSPLYGKTGAAYVFAPQKGADEKAVELLDRGLRIYADTVFRETGKDNAMIQGAGAAGGLGYALLTFFDAELCKGAPTVLEAMGFEKAAETAELVITGEGCMDDQSILGKAPAWAAEMSGDTPVIAVVGRNRVSGRGISKIRKIYASDNSDRSFEEIKAHAEEDLRKAAALAAEEFLGNKK